MNVDQKLNKLDVMLDQVEELIRSLPMNDAVKKRLASEVYAIWMEVEDQMELASTDFS